MGGTSLLFGTVTAAHNAGCIRALRVYLDKTPSLGWIRDTASELPGYWDLLSSNLPEECRSRGPLHGRESLESFDRWLRQGFGTDDSSVPLGNTVLLPLVVIVGLAEFYQYVESKNPGCEDPVKEFLAKTVADNAGGVESIGMCAGLLTAYAVASSHNSADLAKYGAVAIRIAMMLGASTDAQDDWHGQAKSYVAAWRTPEQGEQMKKSVELVYPQAYISVLYDERRVTITTTAYYIRSTILRQLQGTGLAVAESNTQGYIHCPNSESKAIADAICQLCADTPSLQLGDVSKLAFPTYTNEGHGRPVETSLHDVAIQSGLAQQCRWYETFAALPVSKPDSTREIVAFGPDRCVPQSLVPKLTARLTQQSDLTTAASSAPAAPATSSAPTKPAAAKPDNMTILPPSSKPTTTTTTQVPSMTQVPSSKTEQKIDQTTEQASKQQPQQAVPPSAPERTIAIVGMAIRAAGADDAEEFSRMLQTGESQHQLVGPDRVRFHTLFREGDWDPSYKWYANLMRDVDSFDHQFFKRSPREAANMDPQQRLALQVAYQTVENAGYYSRDGKRGAEFSRDQTDPNHVGVYVGVTSDDYQSNVRSQRANAYSLLGTCRSLIAGKVAHHFGWTGPAMTIDSACSSSAAAIHNACRDLLAGDCNAALAGGANVITDPLVFQDLAAGGLLSPSGQCKPFDDRADGYCRGETVGFVFMKRLSDALADGNQIFGCIQSSAFYQNENHTPIFVPNSPSLTGLFQDVLKKADIQPSEVSVVECHGTGTSVGDPAEWEGVRQALDGPQRNQTLYIGSSKGHVGHTEGSSGMVALIKVLTMLQSGCIPPQASHSRLSHLVQPSDTMEVPTSQQPWNPTRKVALINNYGASGSNVAMVVTESPFPPPQAALLAEGVKTGLPFCITGRIPSSVKANCARILQFITANPAVNLVDLAFNMQRQSSRSLPNRVAFKCSSIEELKTKLSQVVSGSATPGSELEITTTKSDRPVILCFGGQVSKSVGLDRDLYDRAQILRQHLDECDAAIQSHGLKSIYPDIFSQDDVQDQQHLQTMLFAMQYSCAKSWMQSGLESRVAALVGHSFGELTAMCISGVLSLQDAVKLISGRARLVRDIWGPDSGAMLAVEADKETVDSIISEANQAYSGSFPANIACYNGPRSFTLAGSQQVIAVVTGLLSRKFPSIRSKALKVTNAFHSSLVGPLERQLELLGRGITFQKPRIPLERATETKFDLELLGPQYVAEQMRKPVYFHHAVQRLAQEYPDCVFLEAGSSSTVTVMAQRALDSASKTSHFQGLKITDSNAFNNLSDATVSLWKEGVPTSFWPHNAVQTKDYANLILPPYQFEKDKHWVELRSPVEFVEKIKETVRAEVRAEMSVPQTIEVVDTNSRWVLTGYKDGDAKKQPCFRINKESKQFQEMVTTHVVTNTAGICSGMLQINLACTALFSLHPEWEADGFRATLLDMANLAPVCLDPSEVLSVEFEDRGNGFWDFKLVGTLTDGSRIQHTTGRFQLRDPKDTAYQAEFRRLGRLIDYARCSALMSSGPCDDDVEILKGQNLYKAFSPIVDFGEKYHAVRWLIGRGNECAGRVSRTKKNDAWFDMLRGEHISQVGGIWANCMAPHDPSDLFLGSELETWMVSPAYANRSLPDEFDVFTRHQLQEDTGDYTSDSFVFDPVSGELVEVFLGVRFTKTASSSFGRVLARMTSGLQAGAAGVSAPTVAKPIPATIPAPAPVAPAQPVVQQPRATAPAPPRIETPRRDLIKEMGVVVAHLVGVEVEEIGPDDNLVDFGVDSLLGMELLADIKAAFECTPDPDGMMTAATLRDLVRCLPIAGQDTVNSGIQQQPDSPDEFITITPPSDNEWSNVPSEDGRSPAAGHPDALWTPADVMESFSVTKKDADDMVVKYGLDVFVSNIIPDENRMCAVLVADAFEELGCPMRGVKAGELMNRVPYKPQHQVLVDNIYKFLQNDVDLLTIDADGKIRRTATPVPEINSKDALKEIIERYPTHGDFHQLTHHSGLHLARGLSGLTDGVKVLMGNPEMRALNESVYLKYPLNLINFDMMTDFVGRLASRIRASAKGPLRVLELGAGTGSATSALLPLLASLNVPVEYTFTDLSSSLVAKARRTLGKKYPFMRFQVQNIEEPVGEELAGKQHIVFASHAIHATRNLTVSTRNIRGALRPEGFLMMLEMREGWPALDQTYGLYEGWALFEDGRTHAYCWPDVWKRHLTAAGYGAMDFTDGVRPEHKHFMVVVALASALE